MRTRVDQILIILMAPASETSVFPCVYWEVAGIGLKANAGTRTTNAGTRTTNAGTRTTNAGTRTS